MDLEVADNPDKARFEIVADGELAGFVQYHLRGDEIAFTHTQTDDRFRGQGIAWPPRTVKSRRRPGAAPDGAALLPVREELDHRAPRVRRPDPGRRAPAVRPVRPDPPPPAGASASYTPASERTRHRLGHVRVYHAAAHRGPDEFSRRPPLHR